MCNLLWNQTHNTRNAHPVAPARAHTRPPARCTDTHARTHICTRARTHTCKHTRAHTRTQKRGAPLTARPPSRAVPPWEVRANPRPRARAQAPVAPAGLVPLGLQGSELREGLSAGKKGALGARVPLCLQRPPPPPPSSRAFPRAETERAKQGPRRVQFRSGLVPGRPASLAARTENSALLNPMHHGCTQSSEN